MKAKVLAAAGLIAIVVEVVLTKLPLLKRTVMFVATLCDKLEKLTKPFAAVTIVVPCSVPLPALRLAATAVELSAFPLAELRKLPNWSST